MNEGEALRRFAHRALIAAGVVTAVVVALVLLWALAEVWLLLFAGLVFAILLRALTRPLARLRLPEHLAYAAVVTLVLAALILLLLVFVPLFAQGIADLTRELPHTLLRIAERLRQYEWGRALLDQISDLDVTTFSRALLARLGGFFTTAIGAFSAFLLVFITGVYLGAEPRQYERGTLALLPPSARPRAAHILIEIRRALEWWLVGRIISMLLIGLFTWLALRWLQVPLAATLALLATVLSFIPNFGALLSAFPAVVIAAGVSPLTGGYVVLLYLVIHLVEAYLVGPIIARHTITLPPATVLITQIAFTALYGFPGLLLAGPLTVLLMVLIRTIYLDPPAAVR